MKITKIGSDLICVSDQDYDDNISSNHKVHLIKLSFTEPTSDKMLWVTKTFKNTNRFIINDHVSFYNSYLKHTQKKYYIINTEINSLVSFYKKNNKVLLDITKLSIFERQFILNVILEDILSITEVIAISREDYISFSDKFDIWNGNLIILDDGESI